MMFELSPFGIVLPEWVLATATLVLWFGLLGAVLHLARGTET
jgi:hypothetical protein